MLLLHLCLFHYEAFFNQHLPPTGSCIPSAMLLVACCTSISPDEYDVTSCVRSLTVSGETGVGNSADWLSGIVISSSGGGGGKSESGLGYISSETELRNNFKQQKLFCFFCQKVLIHKAEINKHIH